MRHLFLFINVILFMAAPCARAEERTGASRWLPPENQQAMRADHAFTVGVPLVAPYNLPGHFQWRPTGRFTIGAGYDAALRGSNDQQISENYQLHAHQHSALLYVQYFPLEHSGFNLGLGAETRFGTFRVDRTINGDGDGRLAANGRYQALYGGPSFGETWIWASGITFGFDVTKRKRFKSMATLTRVLDGLPDSLAGDVAEKVTPDTVSGTVMLGYSF